MQSFVIGCPGEFCSLSSLSEDVLEAMPYFFFSWEVLGSFPPCFPFKIKLRGLREHCWSRGAFSIDGELTRKY